MAIKKSELYSSIWASCDQLRGGMDASQYKDYVLVLLFIKYISDKFDGEKYAPITIPRGSGFKDMVGLKGKTTIGDDINKKIIAPLIKANPSLASTIDVADFNNPDKLGSGDDMVKRLTNLIAIFENPALDFKKNKAEGDDILGDAYEYLMRHFATESGKSKGQFYTPSEVSRIMAKIIGVHSDTKRDVTVYDPTCGSGSLLLKVSDEADKGLSIYGQENDSATAALARMNMVLHNNPTAEIKRQNTLASPLFLDEKGNLKLFDFVVANPPFSFKSWSNGVDAVNDPFGRFQDFGIPPQKNGDYAFLLHIIRSLKSKGKGAVILPHGVLFRGNVEGEIRKIIVQKGLIKGIIGLPANLFYGTGIPACIIVLDKENASNRKGIFMIDASRGYIKDGNKNRLLAQDIHRIVDTFNRAADVEKFSRMISVTEIEKNEFNLNIPRYIDSQEEEDIQSIEAHLKGDIPDHDIESLVKYWEVYKELKNHLFEKSKRTGFQKLKSSKEKIREEIYSHPEFGTYGKKINSTFTKWKAEVSAMLKSVKIHDRPKRIIHEISESLLGAFHKTALVDPYDVYQYLMSYWEDIMQDDVYMIVQSGWTARVDRILVKNKKGKEEDKGWKCDLVPKNLVTDKFFHKEAKAIEDLMQAGESLEAKLAELSEENSGEEGALSDVTKKSEAIDARSEYYNLAWKSHFPDTYKAYEAKEKTSAANTAKLDELESLPVFEKLQSGKKRIAKGVIKTALQSARGKEKESLEKYMALLDIQSQFNKELKELWLAAVTQIDSKMSKDANGEYFSEIRILNEYLELLDQIAENKKSVKEAEQNLDDMLLAKYPKLKEAEIKELVVDDKWLKQLDMDLHSEMDKISQRLTARITELSERYENTLPELTQAVNEFESKVQKHLQKMGFAL